MAKLVADVVLDNGLNILVNSGSHMNVNQAAPTTFAHAAVDYNIAWTVMSDGSYGVGDGDVSGRKCSVHQVADIAVNSSENANYISIVDSENGALLYATTCTSQDLTQGNTVTVNSWDIEIADPS